jgi:hypothetical protein
MPADYETFGEEAVNDYFINRIKYILYNYSSDTSIIKYNLELIKDDYYETLSNEEKYLTDREKEDNFNSFIEEAKFQIEDEGLPRRNNVPYNGNELIGGRKSYRQKSMRMRSKSKSMRMRMRMRSKSKSKSKSMRMRNKSKSKNKRLTKKKTRKNKRSKNKRSKNKRSKNKRSKNKRSKNKRNKNKS